MKKYMVEQSGRSMIEMLGVLAIVGVLSVAGIAGYSKAMAKYKVNKLTDQVTMIAANIRTIFAGQGNYNGLTNKVAYDLGAFPEEVAKACDVAGGYPAKGGCLKNAMGGAVEVAVHSGSDYSFDLVVDALSKDACATLVTSDWGSAAGLDGMLKTTAGEDGADSYVGKGTDVYDVTDMQKNSLANVASICTCKSDSTCVVGWRFK